MVRFLGKKLAVFDRRTASLLNMDVRVVLRRHPTELLVTCCLFFGTGAVLIVFAPGVLKVFGCLGILASLVIIKEWIRGGFYICFDQVEVRWGTGNSVSRSVQFSEVAEVRGQTRSDDRLYFYLRSGNRIELDTRWVSFRSAVLRELRLRCASREIPFRVVE